MLFPVEYLQREQVPVKHMSFPERTAAVGNTFNAYLENKSELSDTFAIYN